MLDTVIGGGTVLTRAMHNMFPTIPFLIVGKEFSLECRCLLGSNRGCQTHESAMQRRLSEETEKILRARDGLRFTNELSTVARGRT